MTQKDKGQREKENYAPCGCLWYPAENIKTLRQNSNAPTTHLQTFPQVYRYKLKVTRIGFVESVFKGIKDRQNIRNEQHKDSN